VQYSLLTTLEALGEIDLNMLAVEIEIERSSVAEVIPHLDARGLVNRKQAAHDSACGSSGTLRKAGVWGRRWRLPCSARTIEPSNIYRPPSAMSSCCR
jgi:hypothetical protein